MGFQDFAGSTIVHSTGGWAALAGAVAVGARKGKFRRDGSVKSTPPSNVPAVTLGVFILWLGWFGFNGGSQLALAGAVDAVAMSNVLVNTNLAAAAGVMAAMSVSRPIIGRVDLLVCLNGAIAGPRLDHRGAGHHGPLLGGRHRRDRRRPVYGRREAHGVAEDRRRGGGGARPPLRRGMGHARGLHRSRRELRHSANRGARDRSVRVRGLVDPLADHRKDAGRAGIEHGPRIWGRTPRSSGSKPIPSSWSCPTRTTSTSCGAGPDPLSRGMVPASARGPSLPASSCGRLRRRRRVRNGTMVRHAGPPAGGVASKAGEGGGPAQRPRKTGRRFSMNARRPST